MLLRSVGLRGGGAAGPPEPSGTGTDFSEYAANAQPSGWTKRGVTTDDWRVIKGIGGFMGGSYLTCNKTSGSQVRLLTWDEVPAADSTIEVLALIRLQQSPQNSPIGVAVRVNSSGSGYVLAPHGLLTHVQLSTININGSIQSLAVNSGVITGRAIPMWFRLRADGDQITGKVWHQGAPEPAGWQVSATDSTFPNPGHAGIAVASTYTGEYAQVDFFDYREGGDTVPLPGNWLEAWGIGAPFDSYVLRIVTSAATSTAQSARTVIAELALRDEPGGAQLAVGGTPAANSVSGGDAAARAFDGNAATNWQSGAYGGINTWLRYLGATNPFVLAEVALTASANASQATNSTPRVAMLYGIDGNGDEWPLLLIDNETGWGAGETRVFPV